MASELFEIIFRLSLHTEWLLKQAVADKS